MTWIKLTKNRKRVREALTDGYVDEVIACRATTFDQLAGVPHPWLLQAIVNDLRVLISRISTPCGRKSASANQEMRGLSKCLALFCVAGRLGLANERGLTKTSYEWRHLQSHRPMPWSISLCISMASASSVKARISEGQRKAERRIPLVGSRAADSIAERTVGPRVSWNCCERPDYGNDLG